MGSDVGAARIEEGHRLKKSHTNLTDDMVGRDTRSVEEEFDRVGVGEIPLQLASAVLIGGYDECRDATGRALLRVCDSEDDREIGCLAIGDVVLVPVNHPLVTLEDGSCPDRLGVAARLGLRERKAHGLGALHYRKEVGIPQVRGQLEEQGRRTGGVGWGDRSHRETHARPGRILHEKRCAQDRQSLSADILGHVGRVEALLGAAPANPLDDGCQHIAVGGVTPELRCVLILERAHLALKEGGEGLAQGGQLVGDGEVHGTILPHHRARRSR